MLIHSSDKFLDVVVIAADVVLGWQPLRLSHVDQCAIGLAHTGIVEGFEQESILRRFAEVILLE